MLQSCPFSSQAFALAVSSLTQTQPFTPNAYFFLSFKGYLFT